MLSGEVTESSKWGKRLKYKVHSRRNYLPVHEINIEKEKPII